MTKVILIFFFLIRKVFAIDCYQCVSTNQTNGGGCRLYFDQWNTPYVTQCKQTIAGESHDAFACLKIEQTIGKIKFWKFIKKIFANDQFCFESTEEIGQPGIVQRKIIRDCISVPMKQGCEKRQISNYKLFKKPTNIIMTQCVYQCQEDGCNKASSFTSPFLIGLIGLIVFVFVMRNSNY